MTSALFTSTQSVQSDQKRGRIIAQMTARGAFITHPDTLSDSLAGAYLAASCRRGIPGAGRQLSRSTKIPHYF